MRGANYYLEIIEKVLNCKTRRGSLNDLASELFRRSKETRFEKMVMLEVGVCKKVDKAIERWLQTRLIPRIDPECEPFFALRFYVITEFLSVMNHALKPQFRAPPEDVLRWLLLHHWTFWGRGFWMVNCFKESPLPPTPLQNN